MTCIGKGPQRRTDRVRDDNRFKYRGRDYENDLAAAIAIGCVLLFALAVGSPLSIGTSL